MHSIQFNKSRKDKTQTTHSIPFSLSLSLSLSLSFFLSFSLSLYLSFSLCLSLFLSLSISLSLSRFLIPHSHALFRTEAQSTRSWVGDGLRRWLRIIEDDATAKRGTGELNDPIFSFPEIKFKIIIKASLTVQLVDHLLAHKRGTAQLNLKHLYDC